MCFVTIEINLIFKYIYTKVLSYLGTIPKLTVRSKRKGFAQLSVYGRRRALKDVRGLFKKKEVEYKAKISRMAGFLIQQVIVTDFKLDGSLIDITYFRRNI